MKKMRVLAITIGVLCSLTLAFISYAGVYQWTDESGKVHYSDKNPNKSGMLNNKESTEVKKIETSPVNKFSADDVLLSEEQMKTITPLESETTNNQTSTNTDATVAPSQPARQYPDRRNNQQLGPDWEWNNGTVRNPHYNSSVTKTAKGEFILRNQYTSCNAKTFKDDMRREMNVNSQSVRFKTVCIGGLVSLIPEHSRGNSTLDKQFSRSSGSVDIGGVRYGTKGYK